MIMIKKWNKERQAIALILNTFWTAIDSFVSLCAGYFPNTIRRQLRSRGSWAEICDCHSDVCCVVTKFQVVWLPGFATARLFLLSIYSLSFSQTYNYVHYSFIIFLRQPAVSVCLAASPLVQWSPRVSLTLSFVCSLLLSLFVQLLHLWSYWFN